MRLTIRLLIIFTFSLFIQKNLHGQNTERVLLISKISKPEKVRRIVNGTRLKIQTQSGNYIRTKLNSVGKDYFLTQQLDTIYFNDIYSFRAQRKINKTECVVGVPLLAMGVAAMIGGVPLSFVLILMQEAGPGIFLIPLAGVISTAAGYKIVGRKTYRMDNWTIFSEN